MIYSFNYPQRVMALHSMLKFCGREAADADYRWAGLKRGGDFILWQHTTAGLGRLAYQGREYDLRPGCSMLLHMPHDHVYYRPADSAEWRFDFAIVNGREVVRIARELERLYGPVHHLAPDSRAAELLGDTVDSAEALEGAGQFQLSGRAYLLITALAAEIADARETADCPPAVRRAIDLVLKSPGQPPDVAALAAAAGMSRWHFSREFKRCTGMTPAAYVRDHLLRRAESLLQQGRLSVKEIADRSGYALPAGFIRAYRRAYGRTPGDLKK